MSSNKYIGAHVSIAGGVQNAPLRAQAIGASAFGLFVKNQRQWKANPLRNEEIDGFIQNCRQCGISSDHIVAHDSYLINLGHPDRLALKKSRSALLEEVLRCEQLGVRMLNSHPGSHLRTGTLNRCLQRIADSINFVLERSNAVKILLENTAGQGSNVGYAFDQLSFIIHRIEDPARIGVCLDTCHTFAAGYDLRDSESFERTWSLFDEIIGRKWLCSLHLNDAKSEFNSHVDRHASLGKGKLGWSAFASIMQDARLDGLPMILETPQPDCWAEEIQLLHQLGDRRQ